MAHCWRSWGERYNYFASKEDAGIFYDELVYTIVGQLAAPNSPQWFNTGLHEVYGITGKPQGHYFVDPTTEKLSIFVCPKISLKAIAKRCFLSLPRVESG